MASHGVHRAPYSAAILRKLMPCFPGNSISTYTSFVIMAAAF